MADINIKNLGNISEKELQSGSILFLGSYVEGNNWKTGNITYDVLSGTLANVISTNMLPSLENTITYAIKSQISDYSENINNIDGKVNILSLNISRNISNISCISTNLNKLSTSTISNINTISTAVSTLSTNVYTIIELISTELNTDINTISTALSTQVSTNTNNIQNLINKVDDIDKKINDAQIEDLSELKTLLSVISADLYTAISYDESLKKYVLSVVSNPGFAYNYLKNLISEGSELDKDGSAQIDSALQLARFAIDDTSEKADNAIEKADNAAEKANNVDKKVDIISTAVDSMANQFKHIIISNVSFSDISSGQNFLTVNITKDIDSNYIPVSIDKINISNSMCQIYSAIIQNEKQCNILINNTSKDTISTIIIDITILCQKK